LSLLTENDLTLDRLNHGYDTFNSFLQNNSNFNLTFSSNLYLDNRQHFVPEFEKSVNHFFRKHPILVDFSRAQSAADLINNDVANQTDNLISNLMVESEKELSDF
jgi:serine protease inhibitor